MAVKSGTASSSTVKACISSTSSSAASTSCASACWQSGSAARPNLRTMARSVSERSVSSTHVALGSEPSATAAAIWACLTFRLSDRVSEAKFAGVTRRTVFSKRERERERERER